MERAILHSDLNCFYASVEMMLNPMLRGKAVAVCGSTEDRHGIVLAKSEKAKNAYFASMVRLFRFSGLPVRFKRSEIIGEAAKLLCPRTIL